MKVDSEINHLELENKTNILMLRYYNDKIETYDRIYYQLSEKSPKLIKEPENYISKNEDEKQNESYTVNCDSYGKMVKIYKGKDKKFIGKF